MRLASLTGLQLGVEDIKKGKRKQANFQRGNVLENELVIAVAEIVDSYDVELKTDWERVKESLGLIVSADVHAWNVFAVHIKNKTESVSSVGVEQHACVYLKRSFPLGPSFINNPL
ncbi:hypothetical protein APHAL10511_005149 [Amanita phalloides]|nr:hypothetical protein APHAL10511_005149 [Amanita phalloides]